MNPNNVWLLVVRWLLACTLLLAPGIGAQDRNMREHLGTRVTATPETIVLDWDSKHLWSADLARGASLIAEYNTRNQGVVLQKLATGRVAGANVPSMHFIMPAELTVPPIGPVCLFIQLGSGRMLPVRKGSDGHADTARFRDQAWESQAVARSGDTAQRTSLAAYEDAAREADHQVELQRDKIGRRGVTEVASCYNVTTPSFTVERSFDVLSPADIPDGARRACITRVRGAALNAANAVRDAKPENKAETLAEHLIGAVMPPALISAMLRTVKLAPDLTRAQQLAELQRDWSQFSNNPDLPPHLLLGDENDRISLQSVTRDTNGQNIVLLLVTSWINQPLPPDELKKIKTSEVAGFIGGELEAYSRCVVDSQHQLQTKFDEWQEGQRRAPELRESARRQLVGECRADFTRMDALLAQQKAAHERLEAFRTSVQPTTAKGGPGAASVVLNDAACSPR